MAKNTSNGTSKSHQIRKAAREILISPGAHMKMGELKKLIAEKLGIVLRNDNLLRSLTTKNSGIDVVNGIVIMTRIFGSSHDAKTAKPTTRKVRKKVAKKTIKRTKAVKTKSVKSTTKRVSASKSKKMSVLEFTLLAIKKLSKPPHKGIHVVYSKFNSAFREYFPDLDVREEIDKLITAGKLWKVPAKGGIIIMAEPPANLGDASASAKSAGRKALKDMGIN